MAEPVSHPYLLQPNKTLIRLSVPVLLSLIAEPLTGLVDTAFVASLGAEPLAALGVGATVLAGVFWIFNFLGIGTQTEVARSGGRGQRDRAVEACSVALMMGIALGLLLCAAGVAGSPWAATAMGAKGTVHADAVIYMNIRFLGAPAILATIAAFGALRGLQDMKTPLVIAVAINALNILLDWILIFGPGPVPALGIAGAAWATVVSQWVGAVLAVMSVKRSPGISMRISLRQAGELLVVGGDLFIRTGLLTAFLILTTRAATLAGADTGAAHQAIRQVWLFTALFLDSFAISGQSLIGFFIGAGHINVGRRVAAHVCLWSLGTGAFLAVGMLLGEPAASLLLVPPSAQELFLIPWVVAALIQPVNAVAFATDGIHWGTGDFRYLRNAMIASTGVGTVLLLLIDTDSAGALTWIWLVTGLWILTRSVLGVLRVWPGVFHAPLNRARVLGTARNEGPRPGL